MSAISPVTMDTHDRMQSIKIDGTINHDEWSGALKKDLNGTFIYFKTDDKNLYVAVKSNRNGLGHVCLYDGDSVYVLHASASIGGVAYSKDKNEQWTCNQQFIWQLKGISDAESAVQEMKIHFDQFKWVANTTSLGTPGHKEFVISRKFRKKDIQSVIIVEAGNPMAPKIFPENIEDGSKNFQLLMGSPPASLLFKPAEWMSAGD